MMSELCNVAIAILLTTHLLTESMIPLYDDRALYPFRPKNGVETGLGHFARFGHNATPKKSVHRHPMRMEASMGSTVFRRLFAPYRSWHLSLSTLFVGVLLFSGCSKSTAPDEGNKAAAADGRPEAPVAGP